MRKYFLPENKYHDLWEKIEKEKGRGIDHQVIDRWLSIYHGLSELSDTADENGFYPFAMRDETKAAWFTLKYI